MLSVIGSLIDLCLSMGWIGEMEVEVCLVGKMNFVWFLLWFRYYCWLEIDLFW